MNQNILEPIVNTMVLAQNSKLGTYKKSFVLSVIKMHIPDFEIYEPIVSLIIDFIKLLSKNNEIIKV